MALVIRNAERSDFQSICALNLTEVQHTSPTDEGRLGTLARLACYHRVASKDDVVAAFLLAMCDGVAYENENFAWFETRYARFLYIDRVVVSSAFRGLGIASLLYDDVFHYARDNAIAVLTCEYNLIPPNEPSRIFHRKFGFKECGTQWLANGTKRVSLQVAETQRPL